MHWIPRSVQFDQTRSNLLCTFFRGRRDRRSRYCAFDIFIIQPRHEADKDPNKIIFNVCIYLNNDIKLFIAQGRVRLAHHRSTSQLV